MNIKRILALALVAICVIATSVIITPALAAQETVTGTAKIYSANGGKVNVRSKPDTSQPLAPVGTLPSGTAVTLTARDKDSSGKTWYKIKRNNDVGWVRSDFLTNISATTGGTGGGSTNPEGTASKPAATGSRIQGYVATSSGSLNIRASVPSGSVLVQATRNRTIYYYKTTNSEWHYVEYTHSDGATYKGYASAGYIKAGAGSTNEKVTCKNCGSNMTWTSYLLRSNEWSGQANHGPYNSYHSCDYFQNVYARTYYCPNDPKGSSGTTNHSREYDNYYYRKWWCENSYSWVGL